MKKELYKKVLFLSLVFFLLTIVSFYFLIGRKDRASEIKISRQIRFSFLLKNITDVPVEKTKVWVYGPIEFTSTQICKSIEASHPFELKKDDCGNQMLQFSFEKIPPYASKVINIKADLLLSNQTGKDEFMNVMSSDLDSELFVESDHPELTRLAERLQRESVQKTAESIYQWVADHVEYSGYLMRERGALYAFLEREGDCTEYMDLFAALCRAVGIPCKRVGGYICEKNAVLTASQYHNWAQVFIGERWHVADPQNQVFKKNESAYIAMQFLGEECASNFASGNRFRFEGEGIRVRMNP